ncbi:MAG: DUF2059 domain-containing protein [Betaproteobacteria bacterium]|nr:DUF2059 domain-containing protein [Betaproteobacteria bacterium]
MNIVRVVILVIALLAAAPPGALADDLSPEKRADIERLLEMTGALSIAQQMSDMVVTEFTNSLRQSRPDVPKEVLDLLPEIIHETFAAKMGALKDEMIPIYHRHFTDDEIREMIRFYSTDLGQKTIRVMPSLIQESMVAGRHWGEALAPELQRRIRARFKQAGVEI